MAAGEKSKKLAKDKLRRPYKKAFIHKNKYVSNVVPKKQMSFTFDTKFLELLTNYMSPMREYFSAWRPQSDNPTISKETKQKQEALWKQIEGCIFESYLKGKSLCYYSQSQKNEYPLIFHSMHNRKKFPKKKLIPSNNNEENLLQMWLLNEISDEEDSGTECSSSSSFCESEEV